MAISPHTNAEPPAASDSPPAQPDTLDLENRDVTLVLPSDLHAATPPPSRARRRWRVAASPAQARLLIALLGAGFLALYGSTFTQRYTFDSISYATEIRRVAETGNIGRLFHPHHLLFNGIGLLFYSLLRRWDPGIDALTALQAATAFFGALGLTALAALLYEETASPWAALTAAIVLGGTFGWWFAATDGRANLAATAVLLWGLYTLRRAARSRSLLGWAGAGALFGLTCLIHQSHALFVPVALLAALFTGGGGIGARLLRAAILGVAFALAVGIPYGVVLVGVKGFHSLGDALNWLTTYGRQDTWWSLDWQQNLPRDAEALYKAFTGQSLAPAWTPTGEPADGRSPGERWGQRALALWGLPALVAITGTARGALRRRGGFLLPPALGLVVYAAFFTVWDPGYFVHWLAQSAFLVLLIAGLWPEGARHWLTRLAVTACAGALVWVTWAGAVAERTRGEDNPHRALALRVAGIADRQGIVIASGMSGAAEAEVYIPYFARMQVIALHAAWADAGGDTKRATRDIRATVDRVLRRGNQVYLLSEALYDPGSLRAMHRRYGVSDGDLRAVFAPYDREAVDRNGYVVIYRLKERPPEPALPAKLGPPLPAKPLPAKPGPPPVRRPAPGAPHKIKTPRPAAKKLKAKGKRPRLRRAAPPRRSRRYKRVRQRRYGIMRAWSPRGKSSSSARPAR